MYSLLRGGFVSLSVLLDTALAYRMKPADGISSIVQGSTPSLNSSASLFQATSSANSIHLDAESVCGGLQHGYGLDVVSCLDALGRLDRRSTTRQSWGRSDQDFDISFPKTY